MIGTVTTIVLFALAASVGAYRIHKKKNNPYGGFYLGEMTHKDVPVQARKIKQKTKRKKRSYEKIATKTPTHYV